jgi:hypothetical protein
MNWGKYGLRLIKFSRFTDILPSPSRVILNIADFKPKDGWRLALKIYLEAKQS